jgi:hypothetical protein
MEERSHQGRTVAATSNERSIGMTESGPETKTTRADGKAELQTLRSAGREARDLVEATTDQGVKVGEELAEEALIGVQRK